MTGVADFPCWHCGTRADIGCKHRQPIGPPPAGLDGQTKTDNRGGKYRAIGNGHNFKGAKAEDLIAKLAVQLQANKRDE